MKHTPRLFSCALCLLQTVICSHCDRGQIYCSPECSQAARQKSCREAEKRYQNTLNGKMKHALRQRRYRERLRKIVTDHGSQSTPQDALLHSVENKTTKMKINHEAKTMRCSFCQNAVSFWLRRGFLRPSYSQKEALLLYSRPP